MIGVLQLIGNGIVTALKIAGTAAKVLWGAGKLTAKAVKLLIKGGLKVGRFTKRKSGTLGKSSLAVIKACRNFKPQEDSKSLVRKTNPDAEKKDSGSKQVVEKSYIFKE